jgi:hypothetical protein
MNATSIRAVLIQVIRVVWDGDLLKGNELDALLVSELKERPSGVVALLTVERMAKAKHTNWHKTLTELSGIMRTGQQSRKAMPDDQ